MGKVDILTVGNEPFFETSQADRKTPRINAFYEALALHTANYRQAHFGTHCKTKIYMGALTALNRPGAQTAQTRRWMTFTAHTSSIAGVDIQPHHGIAKGTQFGSAFGSRADFKAPGLNDGQPFSATALADHEHLLVVRFTKNADGTVTGTREPVGVPASYVP